ncbi:NUDIX domain-containing protein [Actinacidiphila yeochonensis]|uniref:NUDIX domain-containing protein n=1 Tax=Actinacidiphila yeochonensis TaxID=89050 RepID=UPI000560E8C3|nr:NUDIX hydrolase [Actinacidiphila yeochonensis]
MIIWVNGAFGAGKADVAHEMLDLVPESTLFDPAALSECLRRLLPEKQLQEVAEYQDLPMWRRLLVESAASLLAEVGGVLVAPVALLRQEHRDEVFGGLAARGVEIRHLLLEPGETILRERALAHAQAGPAARDRALRRLADYAAALPWLVQDAHVVDTTGLTPRQAACAVAEAVSAGGGARAIVQTPEPRAETVASGVLLFDDADRVLLVDPTYKPGWEFPGGIVERGESPARAGHREVAEELGIQVAAGLDLLVVDWEPPHPPGHGGLRLLFDGGHVTPRTISRLLLPRDELRGWRFVTEEEAADLLPAARLDRLRWALRAREQGRPLNLEAGQPAR